MCDGRDRAMDSRPYRSSLPLSRPCIVQSCLQPLRSFTRFQRFLPILFARRLILRAFGSPQKCSFSAGYTPLVG